MNNLNNSQKMAALTTEQKHNLTRDMRVTFEEGVSYPQDLALDLVRDIFIENQIKDELGCLFEGNLEILSSFGIQGIKSSYDHYTEMVIPIFVVLNHIPD